MNVLLIKMLSLGLTLSQLFGRPPEQFKPSFNPQTDQAQVSVLLGEGCRLMVKEFSAENVDFESLLAMMVANVQAQKAKAVATPGNTDATVETPPIPTEKNFTDKVLEQIDLEGMLASYKMFCKGEKIEGAGVKIEEVIAFYNNALTGIEAIDYRKLKGLKLKEASVILDRTGQRFSEIYSENNRRRWISAREIPDHVKKAFVAAEDKRFFQHGGVDLRGILRAFANNFSGKGRPQGGSTITQQVVKNLLVGDDVTFERKMREMVIAAKLEKEKVLGKDEILELYLNFVFLGRASWGVEMASQSYFGKSVRQLNVNEAAFLAGLTKGPNYYHPDRYPERVEDRRQYVLSRMKEDGYINDGALKAAASAKVSLIPFESPRTKGGYYYLDAINRDARKFANLESLTSGSFTVRSTIQPDLQKLAEAALRDGLADYEAKSGRARWKGPQGSIAADMAKYKSSWNEALLKTKGKLYDVQWPLGVVLRLKKGTQVGLSDGRVIPLNGSQKIIRSLNSYDLVYVNVQERKNGAVATLRIPPTVQGAIVVLENKTGRVLAMSGGFSYAASQYNRVTQAERQPGSTLKPFIYLAALNLGFQPNTLIPDIPVNLPPIARGGRWWSPKNYDGGSRGVVTMRQAIEKSLNLPTARIMTELATTPTEGLDYIRGVTQAAGIYPAPIRQYPFVLGAQPANLLNLAVAYAAIANDGLKPTPHFIDSIEQHGKTLYARPRFSLAPVTGVDRTAFYQLRQILQGVVVRGTAEKLKDLQGFVAGKTGTSNNENDAWFMGFSNDVVIGVWVGYDRRDVRSNLGDRFTGARVALPIAETVFRGSFDLLGNKTELPGPPPEVNKSVRLFPISQLSGEIEQGNFLEVLRITDTGQPKITTRSILRGEENFLNYTEPEGEEFDGRGTFQNLAAFEDMRPENLEDYYRRDSYAPGDDNMSDRYRRQPRREDPFLIQPPFFDNQY